MRGLVVDAFDAGDGDCWGERGVGGEAVGVWCGGFAFVGGGEVVVGFGKLVGAGVLGLDVRGAEGGHDCGCGAGHGFRRGGRACGMSGVHVRYVSMVVRQCNVGTCKLRSLSELEQGLASLGRSNGERESGRAETGPVRDETGDRTRDGLLSDSPCSLLRQDIEASRNQTRSPAALTLQAHIRIPP